MEQNPHCNKIDCLWQEKGILKNCSLKVQAVIITLMTKLLLVQPDQSCRFCCNDRKSMFLLMNHYSDEAAFSASWSVLLILL